MPCPSSSLSSSCTIYHFTLRSSLPNKAKKQTTPRHRRHQHAHQSTSTRHFYPRTRPTPLLLTNQKPQLRTKLEALDAVVDGLEASVDNGVDVMDTQMLCALLETCFNLNAVEHGVRIHRLIPPKILRTNVGVASKLVRLYASNGLVEEAHEVFDGMSERNKSAFVWNSLISGYSELGQYEDALALYFQMEEEGVELDRFTFPRALKACGGIGLVHVGEEIHRHIVRCGFHGDGFVLNALVGMYAKCGDIVKARRVFDKISNKDLVSWNSIITGYSHHGLWEEAICIFGEMLDAGFEPDEVCLSSILKRVAPMGMRIGGQIHGRVLRRGLEQRSTIINALITLYSHHGKLRQARWLFYHMKEKDVVSWNSIISVHAEDPHVLRYFEQMQKEGYVPDSITFLLLLSACANLGYVWDGEQLFLLMREKYGIVQGTEHYACMVNLYGREGLIEKAYDIVTRRMDVEAGPTVWGALLYACFLHGNAAIGEEAAEKLFELEPDNRHNFELLMKIYDGLGRLDDVESVRKMMADRGLDS